MMVAFLAPLPTLQLQPESRAREVSAIMVGTSSFFMGFVLCFVVSKGSTFYPNASTRPATAFLSNLFRLHLHLVQLLSADTSFPFL